MGDLIRRDEALTGILNHYEVNNEIQNKEMDYIYNMVNNLRAVDAVELVRKEAVDFGYLADWYIRSVMNDDPVWTEDHIKELFDDFYLVPKDNGERREEDEID